MKSFHSLNIKKKVINIDSSVNLFIFAHQLFLKTVLMLRSNKKLVVFLLLSLTLHQVKAQFIENWQGRPSLSIKYGISDRWSASGTYYQYFDNNLSELDKSVFGVKAEYKIVLWLKADANYRYGIDKEANYHDLRYSLGFKPNLILNQLQFTYQPLFQQKLDSKEKPENYLRNLLKLDYKLSEKLVVFVLTENYMRLDHGFENHTQKYAFGSEFELSEQSNLEFQITVKDRIGEKRYARLELNYIYQIGK